MEGRPVMRKLVKLKNDEAAIVFRNGGAMIVYNTEEYVNTCDLPPNISNAAMIVFALQHPIFIEIVINFIREVNILTDKMETETTH
jgi:hypothetical protein